MIVKTNNTAYLRFQLKWSDGTDIDIKKVTGIRFSLVLPNDNTVTISDLGYDKLQNQVWVRIDADHIDTEGTYKGNLSVITSQMQLVTTGLIDIFEAKDNGAECRAYLTLAVQAVETPINQGQGYSPKLIDKEWYVFDDDKHVYVPTGQVIGVTQQQFTELAAEFNKQFADKEKEWDAEVASKVGKITDLQQKTDGLKNDNNGHFVVGDENGNVAFKIDDEGTKVRKLYICDENGEILLTIDKDTKLGSYDDGTGVFVVTDESGNIAFKIDNEGLKAKSISFCDENGNITETLPNGSADRSIVVKKDGTGDFTNVVDAVKSITDTHKETNIYIHEGIYDMVADYYRSEGVADYKDSAKQGLYIPDNVNLIGVGSRDNIILKGELPSNIKYNTSQHYSTIYLKGWNNRLENLTITNYNGRYPVHDQQNATDNKEKYLHIVKNCNIIHKGYDAGATATTEAVSSSNNDTTHRWGSSHAYGQGTRGGCTCIFENCTFDCKGATGVSFLTHDASERKIDGTIIDFKNCVFLCTRSQIFTVSSLGNDLDNIVNFVSCYTNVQSPSFGVGISTSGLGTEFVYRMYGNFNKSISVDMPKGFESNNYLY